MMSQGTGANSRHFQRHTAQSLNQPSSHLGSQCSPCLLRNSSKKPFYFDVLKVSFRYLQVEDKQGSSVVKWFSAFLSPRRHGAAFGRNQKQTSESLKFLT